MKTSATANGTPAEDKAMTEKSISDESGDENVRVP